MRTAVADLCPWLGKTKKGETIMIGCRRIDASQIIWHTSHRGLHGLYVHRNDIIEGRGFPPRNDGVLGGCLEE